MQLFHRSLRHCALALIYVSSAALAQPAQTTSSASARIYRCGNEYLNDAALAEARGCKLLDDVYVTVVPGTRVYRDASRESPGAWPGAPRRGASTQDARLDGRLDGRPASQAVPRADAADQRARDSDARSILLAELATAQTRLAEQLAEYNNGEPEKLGPETRNHQRYLDRVNELRVGIQRHEADIASLQRELARLPASTGTAKTDRPEQATR